MKVSRWKFSVCPYLSTPKRINEFGEYLVLEAYIWNYKADLICSVSDQHKTESNYCAWNSSRNNIIYQTMLRIKTRLLCKTLYSRSSCFVTSAYRQLLPRFPPIWSPKAAGNAPLAARTRVRYMQDGAPAHISGAVRGVLTTDECVEEDLYAL
jgi:hypothetical protein